MAENVQWIRLKVGMFDGSSFKKIKRAKIGGVSYRDKLTALWFELLDLAGKSNANGFLIDNNEIPYHSYEDIAIMLDRDEKEVELCMQFFINEKMIEIIDDGFRIKSIGYTKDNSYILDCGDKRTSQVYKNWRLIVLSRDNFACKYCGQTNDILHAHHIKKWIDFPRERFNPDNGITLCANCHKKVHYGG